jgi:hypothetical protein
LSQLQQRVGLFFVNRSVNAKLLKALVRFPDLAAKILSG